VQTLLGKLLSLFTSVEEKELLNLLGEMNQADHFMQDLIPTTRVEVPPVDPVQLVLHSVSLQHEQAHDSPEDFSDFL
jgi:hypothetical protein